MVTPCLLPLTCIHDGILAAKLYALLYICDAAGDDQTPSCGILRYELTQSQFELVLLI